MSTRRWRIRSAPATSGDEERRAAQGAARPRVHGRDDANREPVAARRELPHGEGDAGRLAALGESARDERRRVSRPLLEPGAVAAVDVAAQAEAEARVPGRRA